MVDNNLDHDRMYYNFASDPFSDKFIYNINRFFNENKNPQYAQERRNELEQISDIRKKIDTKSAEIFNNLDNPNKNKEIVEQILRDNNINKDNLVAKIAHNYVTLATNELNKRIEQKPQNLITHPTYTSLGCQMQREYNAQREKEKVQAKSTQMVNNTQNTNQQTSSTQNMNNNQVPSAKLTPNRIADLKTKFDHP